MFVCFNLVDETLQAIERIMMGAPDLPLRRKAFSALRKVGFQKYTQH